MGRGKRTQAAPGNEGQMATSYLSQFLGIMKTQEEGMKDVFGHAIARGQRVIAQHANAAGVIPVKNTRAVQLAIGAIVENIFIGTNRQTGEREPFMIRNTRVVPLSPYMVVLWDAIEDVTSLAVEQHATIMRRYSHPDVVRMVDSIKNTAVIETNPFAQYEPAHTWVDSNGYRLSDRVWNTSNTTRRRLDAFLEQSIREGKSAIRMSKELEQFMLPGVNLRTKRPYGTDASYEAMRLARTETTRAHAKASETAALANEFVDGINVVLSHSHPKRDICDVAAAASPFPKDDIPSEYAIPLHPHCLCHYTYEIVSDIATVREEERKKILEKRARLQDVAGPMLVEAFKDRLLTVRPATPPAGTDPRLVRLPHTGTF